MIIPSARPSSASHCLSRPSTTVCRSAAEKIRSSDVPAKARDLSRTVSQQVGESDLVGQARQAVRRSG